MKFKAKYGPSYVTEHSYEYSNFEVGLEDIIRASIFGVSITLPPGDFKISKTIEINKSNITIDGNGETTLIGTDSEMETIFKIHDNDHIIIIKNLKIIPPLDKKFQVCEVELQEHSINKENISLLDLSDEAISAAYRIAAIQIRKSFAILSSTILSPSLQELFQTGLGKDILNLALGYGLTQISNPHAQKLGEECRVSAIANAGNRLLEELFTELLPQLPSRIVEIEEVEEEDYSPLLKTITAT